MLDTFSLILAQVVVFLAFVIGFSVGKNGDWRGLTQPVARIGQATKRVARKAHILPQGAPTIITEEQEARMEELAHEERDKAIDEHMRKLRGY